MKDSFEITFMVDPYHKYDFCTMWFKNKHMEEFMQWDIAGKFSAKKVLRLQRKSIFETLFKCGWTKENISADFKKIKKRARLERKKKKQ